jgi:hypothetical protein
MHRYSLLATIVAFAFALLAAAPAHAQATRTWVSGVGDDANPCSRTAPCKTFAGAISKTAPAGEINCLDPGGFGAVTITKSITISCEAGTAGVLVSGTNGIVIAAAATDVVYLKGLDIEGLGTGIVGIKFNSGAALFVDSCVIRGFGATNGLGIAFTPSNSATMSVVNTIVWHNGNASNGGGIQVAPTGSATAKATLNRVSVERNFVGIAAIGIGPASEMMIFHSTINGNLNTAVVASGSGATIRIGSSTIANNGGTATSGNVLSYLNNQINSNNPDTVPGGVPGGLH